MAANVLRAAIDHERKARRAFLQATLRVVSVFVVRAFVRLRSILSTQVEMLRKLEELEDKVGEHDKALKAIIATMRQLMAPSPKTPKIGFEAGQEES